MLAHPEHAGAQPPAPADGGHAAAAPQDPIRRIERQTAVLNRNFELLYRRTAIHDRLDRAGYLLLRTLADDGRMDIRTLADRLGLDPSTAGRQIAAMERAGLVERRCEPPDRRRALITPTEEGLARAESVRRERTDGFARLLAGWSEDDLRTLGEMFERYNAAVAAHHLTGGRAGAPPP
ncbi:MarR family transcriptional regulator [Streptomyces tremellae]|uniref:HTH marR-type domain-containing protein n=1 Tax=Streptomyces tremellae TaxID=1124239 RepID=A0ABP7GJA5_9ACTN